MILPFIREARERFDLSSLSDFGCNTGYFLLAARACGYSDVFGYDLDEGVQAVFQQPLMADVTFSSMSMQQVQKPTDITLAISLFHWLIGQAGDDEESLDAVLALLARLSLHTAVLEVVTSDDPLVREYQHYTQHLDENRFLDQSSSHFQKVEKLGSSSPTRHIFALSR